MVLFSGKTHKGTFLRIEHHPIFNIPIAYGIQVILSSVSFDLGAFRYEFLNGQQTFEILEIL